jgi:hypothetical protein
MPIASGVGSMARDATWQHKVHERSGTRCLVWHSKNTPRPRADLLNVDGLRSNLQRIAMRLDKARAQGDAHNVKVLSDLFDQTVNKLQRINDGGSLSS